MRLKDDKRLIYREKAEVKQQDRGYRVDVECM